MVSARQKAGHNEHFQGALPLHACLPFFETGVTSLVRAGCGRYLFEQQKEKELQSMRWI